MDVEHRLAGPAVAVEHRAVAVGGVAVLAGEARRDFMHGIDRADTAGETATRVSATFRTLASGAGRP